MPLSRHRVSNRVSQILPLNGKRPDTVHDARVCCLLRGRDGTRKLTDWWGRTKHDVTGLPLSHPFELELHFRGQAAEAAVSNNMRNRQAAGPQSSNFQIGDQSGVMRLKLASIEIPTPHSYSTSVHTIG